MKDSIIQIKKEIKAKGAELKQNAENKLNAVIAENSSEKKHQNESNSTHVFLQPILWSASAITLFATIFADKNNMLYALLCASTGIGAYVVGNHKKNSAQNKVNVVIADKDILSSKLVRVIRDISDEWENFIEQKKIKVQSLIEGMELQESQKSDLLFHTYVTETINLKAADIYMQMNKIKNSSNFIVEFDELKKVLYRDLCLSIDRAIQKQVEKYDNLIKLL